MKYIILCGGDYPQHETYGPRCLWEINGEKILDRTVRLLWNAGVSMTDIFVCSNDNRVLDHCYDMDYHWFKNPYNTFDVIKGSNIHWTSWVLRDWPGPVCYIFGDVVFSQKAMHEIVWGNDDPLSSVIFYASAPPFDPKYIKIWAEPFAFKVFDQVGFWEAAENVKKWQDEGKYPRVPIAWELWHAYKHSEVLSNIALFDYSEIHAIRDFTCDVDTHEDLLKMERLIGS